MIGRAVLLLVGLAATAAAAAPARLSEAEIRAFVARQEALWNAGAPPAWFAMLTPDATFTDQARSKDGRLVVYGTSTVAEARAQARRLFGKARVRETATVRQVQIAADGKSARVAGFEEAQITTAGKTRRTCAETLQTLVLTPAGLRSKGQTDTVVACR